MRKSLAKWAAIAAVCALPQIMHADDLGTMEGRFRQVPDSQPLAVYWYWMGGNMSKEGVVKDLQAMKKAGINRVQIGMIGSDQGVPQGPVRMFTDEWWDILHTMFRTAGELDIEVGLFNCPGWSQSGGPWVKPSQSMRYLATVTDTVDGPRQLTLLLPSLGKDGQDVRLLAYPLHEQGQDFTVQDPVGSATQIRLTAPVETVARSLTLYPSQAGLIEGELSVKENGQWRVVDRIVADRTNTAVNVGFVPLAPVVVSLPETRGKEFRLDVRKAGLLSRVELSAQPRVERYAEKTFAKMWPSPHPMWDAYMWRNQPVYSCDGVLQPSEVKDISHCMKADGTMEWQVPQGRWVVMRTGMLPTGAEDGPAPEEGRGLETDKMSKEHIRAHFDNYIGLILKKIPAQDRPTFRIVVEDSYETGGQNWTDHMVEDFRQAYGYDPVPYLPAFSGVVVGSQDITDRFLWDVRRLVADEVSYNYVGGLREVSNEHGLTTWLENYGHWGFPGEFLQYGSQSDEIGGEFWSFGSLGDIENRSASSCGHIYGKQKVWAESFTCGGPDFTQYPGQMKQRGDRFFTEGINATLLHLYIQQPDDRVPGFNANFGNEFNRSNTWFSQMDVFARYLKRCNYMLQQGRYVADVAYFLGEDAPKMTGVRNPEIPQGYSYDYVNTDVLMNATVEGGKLHLQSGMEYSLLVLPRIETMRPALLAKLQQLVAEGLVMMGPAPQRSPSLQDYPQADARVQQMAEEMWQVRLYPHLNMVYYGKGRIYRSGSIEQVMADLGIQADFRLSDPTLPVLFIHQTFADGDYYFISNQSDQPITFDAAFRVKGRQPELWNPLTAELRLLPSHTQLAAATRVPLVLAPYESSFVVFRKPVTETAEAGENFPQPAVVADVDGPWDVSFQEHRGGPEGVVRMDSLSDWTTSQDARIRYFSGTATYKTTFKVKKLPATPAYIDLGKVMVMARVRLNGQELGGVWTYPYQLNVAGLLRKGNNELEVEVVNCWRNRLIGEKTMPESERFTFQTATYLNEQSELQSLGLLGPVRILGYDYQLCP